jgi:MoaA/NifB/PqqE/SkfB family radical SAM enzyme/SAM-dependent methyltransferase
MLQIDAWKRFQLEDVSVYISKQAPDWFVPNDRGNALLKGITAKQGRHAPAGLEAFLQKLPPTEPPDYIGRASFLKKGPLRELWFHITNQCDLACSHCLFASSPREKGEIPARDVLQMAAQAHAQGLRLVALTGGEPFVHPDIDQILAGLLDLEDTHVVILTNGMSLTKHLKNITGNRERLHLQISVDGLRENHEGIRGPGSFARLQENLTGLKREKIPFTISMCVSRQNVADMPGVIDLAAAAGAANVHFMWYFVRGRGRQTDFVDTDTIFKYFVQAATRAADKGIPIDNIEALKTQVFAPAGTLHDGTTAGWESIAVGPDLKVYPTAALIGIDPLASNIDKDLISTFHDSPVLKQVREATVATSNSPFRFFFGGGDIDHSYIHNRTFTGDDPYLPLYQKIALWLIEKEARGIRQNGRPGLVARMGEKLASCGAHGKVALTHSNCLLAMSVENSLAVVQSFYADAAGDKKEDILNPICYADDLIDHIPEAYRFRGYGCGSPVLDADIAPGQHIVDLGCGTGSECFIAARLTGSKGRVTGIDMLDPMLALARKGRAGVARNLGYQNIQFEKGLLEYLPLPADSVDVILSNCVMNLSTDKRKAYAEIFRVLRPGGKLVISDVVCETEPDPAIRNDETLRGECIAGALTQGHLLALLEDTGFFGITLNKRFPYREVQGHPFYSLTYTAVKPVGDRPARVIYRGPASALITGSGKILHRGVPDSLTADEAALLGDQVFITDPAGEVVNVVAENTCACYIAPENKPAPPRAPRADLPGQDGRKRSAGCMVCGGSLTYLKFEKEVPCSYCSNLFSANTLCEKGHYVCDDCHAEDALKIIRHICYHSPDTDMVHLMKKIRSHPRIPVNGPEHHSLVPGIILATYRNLGGQVSVADIEMGIKRGMTVAGGNCAFLGACGAALGVGIAFSIILEATPLTPAKRKIAQQATAAALADIASFRAARCCQRDSWLALQKAVTLSAQHLPITLIANEKIDCAQKEKNKECLGKGCPLF